MTHFWELVEFQQLGWTLLHSLWQGAILFALAAVILRLLREKSAQTRYAVACAALGVMFLFAVGTYMYLANQVASGHAVLDASATEAVTLTGEGIRFARLIQWLPLGWILGVFFFSIRLLGGWLWLFRGIKRGATPAASEWQWCADRLSRLLGITRKVRLYISNGVKVPMAAGWLRPIVLLPASALMNLSPESLEAILAHELAHIRRHDYLVNLLQSIVEVLFFYHPATWWLSSQIRELREHCCDDAAAMLCGDPVSYANALANLETLRVESFTPPQPAQAANGAYLMTRIQRLLKVSEPAISGLRAGFIAAAVVAVAGTCVLWGLSPDDKQRRERQRIVIKDGDTSVRALITGEVKLDAYSNDGATLGEGAALVIAGEDNGNKRRYTIRNKDGSVNKTYTVNGEEKPLDADAGAWIKKQVKEIGAVEARKQQFTIKDSDGVSFDITEDGKEGKDSKIIIYSNRRPGTLIAPRMRAKDLGWEGWTGSIVLDRDDIRKSLEELKINLIDMPKFSKEDIEKITASAKSLTINTEELIKRAKELRDEGKTLSQKEARQILKESGIDTEQLGKLGKEIAGRMKDIDIKITRDGKGMNLNALEADLLDLEDFKGKLFIGFDNKNDERRKERLERELQRLKARTERLEKELEQIVE